MPWQPRGVRVMTKKLSCKFGLHHWHYDPQCALGMGFWVNSKCFYCNKEETITGLSIKGWFGFADSWTFDKHNTAYKLLFNLKENK